MWTCFFVRNNLFQTVKKRHDFSCRFCILCLRASSTCFYEGILFIGLYSKSFKKIVRSPPYRGGRQKHINIPYPSRYKIFVLLHFSAFFKFCFLAICAQKTEKSIYNAKSPCNYGDEVLNVSNDARGRKTAPVGKLI